MSLSLAQKQAGLAAVSKLRNDPQVKSMAADAGPWVEEIGAAVLAAEEPEPEQPAA